MGSRAALGGWPLRGCVAVALLPLSILLGLAPARAQVVSCPDEMVLIESYCIDRWEAHLQGQSPYGVPAPGFAVSVQGTVPQGYISGTAADLACAAAGKRLCTDSEWLRACRGPSNTTYPYGNSYVAGACNDTRLQHPVITLYGAGATFSTEQMNDPLLNQLPDSLDPTGSNVQCVSAEGVYDLHGNLTEWTSDPAGTFRGGDYVEAAIDGPGCTNRVTAHANSYHDFSTGFRCCTDPGAIGPGVPTTGAFGLIALAALVVTSGALATKHYSCPRTSS